MNHQQILEYLGTLLNIDLRSKTVSDKILNTLSDMSSEYNLTDFGVFLEEKFNYERFKYLTGYQKFIAMANEFKKENKLKLSEEMQIKALSYSEDLFKRVTNLLDEINFELQEKRKDIKELNLKKTFLKNGFKEYDIKVLRAVGDKNKLMHLSVYGKDELSRTIESIVNKKALVKMYPQLQNKKSEDMKVLERLKNGS